MIVVYLQGTTSTMREVAVVECLAAQVQLQRGTASNLVVI